MPLELHFQIAKQLRRVGIALGAPEDIIIPVDWRGERLYPLFQELGAKSDLLSIIGSYGDGAPDEDVLEMLSRWNAWWWDGVEPTAASAEGDLIGSGQTALIIRRACRRHSP